MNRQKPYAEMIVDHVMGKADYSTAELGAAARRDIGLPEDTPVHVYMPAGSPRLRSDARGMIERRKYEHRPGVILHADGVLEIPLQN